MAGASPTQLTLRALRSRGYTAQVVERWNAFARCRQDLFGIIDVIAVGNGETVGVQCTTYSNFTSRRKKMVEADVIGELRDANWRLLVHGWRKPKHRWECREEDIS